MTAVSYRELDNLGFSPGYRVGDDGSVWSRKNARWGLRAEWRQLKASPDSSGYPMLKLMMSDGRARSWRINVLVLLAFVGSSPTGMESCHNNGMPDDCRLDNLRWDTRPENMRDAVNHGRVRNGSRSNLAKLDEAKVREIRASNQTGVTLAQRYGVSQAAISMIRRGYCWKHVV